MVDHSHYSIDIVDVIWTTSESASQWIWNVLLKKNTECQSSLFDSIIFLIILLHELPHSTPFSLCTRFVGRIRKLQLFVQHLLLACTFCIVYSFFFCFVSFELTSVCNAWKYCKSRNIKQWAKVVIEARVAHTFQSAFAFVFDAMAAIIHFSNRLVVRASTLMSRKIDTRAIFLDTICVTSIRQPPSIRSFSVVWVFVGFCARMPRFG